MYSVVLMMALSGSADVPEFGCRCSGCYGCYGCSCRGGKRCKGCRGCRGCRGCCGCHGYYGCHGCYGYTCCGPVVTCCGCTGITPAPAPMPTKKKTPPPANFEAPATIQVHLPADAKLTVDGNATVSTSADRTFVTPALPVGQSFVYTLRAEVVQNGRTLVQTQQVTVRGGEETSVPFVFPSGVVATSR